MSNYRQALNTAIEAAENASTVIKEYASKQSFSVELKGKNDLLTDADLAAENAIITTICATFPDDEILAEESTGIKALPSGRVWIIDPIDGTTNFAHGFPIYCISIALWENSEPKAALVKEVANGEMFTAVKGEGAYLNGKAITISEIQEPSKSLIGTGFPYKSLHLIDQYLDMFRKMMDKTHGVRRPGTAAWDLCNVACGRFEGFYEYGLNAWDVAAGALIIQEAGGLVTDWQGKQDWLFGERIIAGNEAIHSFLKNELWKSFRKEDLTKK